MDTGKCWNCIEEKDDHSEKELCSDCEEPTCKDCCEEEKYTCPSCENLRHADNQCWECGKCEQCCECEV